MTQNQVNNFCQPMRLGMSHCLTHGGILLKASILLIAEPGNGPQLQLFRNIPVWCFSKTGTYTLDTVRTSFLTPSGCGKQHEFWHPYHRKSQMI